MAGLSGVTVAAWQDEAVKLAGVQADVYRATKPLLTSALNARTPADIRNVLRETLAVNGRIAPEHRRYIPGMSEHDFGRSRAQLELWSRRLENPKTLRLIKRYGQEL